MLTGEIMQTPLTPETVARRVQHYAKLLGFDPKDFGGHSLRRGFITTVRRMGRSIEDIMEVTGHRDQKTLFGYIEHLEIEEGSAARGLIDEAVAHNEKQPPS
jgi:integrase